MLVKASALQLVVDLGGSGFDSSSSQPKVVKGWYSQLSYLTLVLKR